MEAKSAREAQHWVQKPGTGRAIEVGDRLLVHARIALAEDDFDHEGRLILSTYAVPSPVEVRADASELLAEVFAAVVGQRAGSTIVVRVDARSHSLSGRSPLPDVAEYLIELWIEGCEPVADEDELVTLARREVSRARRPAEMLAECLSEARRQANGVYVEVPIDLEADLLQRIGELRRSDATFSEPHRPVSAGAVAPGFLIDTKLYEALKQAIGGGNGP